MVVFTCQHCNDALKKAAVEKHYNTKCRRNPYLTCVDCLNDFRGEEYVGHTQCVSEAERYGDKNFVPKPVAVKQNNWIDVIHNYMNNNSNPKYFSIFERLKNNFNLPRKKPKFINYMSNAMNMKNTQLVGEIFDLFLREFEKVKVADDNAKNETVNNSPTINSSQGSEKTENKNNVKKDKKRNNISESDDINETLNGTSVSVHKEKKKKSKKHKNENGIDHKEPLEEMNHLTDANETLEDSLTMEISDKSKKKKKNKTSKDKENLNVSLNEDVTEVNDVDDTGTNLANIENEGTEKLSKKELKKLKKKQKYEAELKQIEVEKSSECINENDTEENPSGQQPEASKSKKKKRKANVSESELVEVQKKQKVQEEPANNATEDNIDMGETEEPPRKGKFQWDEVIKEVLRSSSDHEMSVKRLSKKVLAEYQSVKGERESFEELMSKFNKKINKIPGVKVLKDKAKLITEN